MRTRDKENPLPNKTFEDNRELWSGPDGLYFALVGLGLQRKIQNRRKDEHYGTRL